MTPAPLLDTHIWLWWLLGDARISSHWVEILDTLPSHERPYLSAISLWEVATLVDLGRVKVQQPLDVFLRIATAPDTVRLVPLSVEVMVKMNQLPTTFHRDPADRLIVASALTLQLPLATQDTRIAASGLVSIWKPEKA
ncbi:MAG: type II toxin-antitoxin system VapC family toxin [Verrucomicrobia bacterium]|nr:type II toxin-antitoxin system VapC family toxin [Verrucomicrobiota bacterium]